MIENRDQAPLIKGLLRVVRGRKKKKSYFGDTCMAFGKLCDIPWHILLSLAVPILGSEAALYVLRD